MWDKISDEFRHIATILELCDNFRQSATVLDKKSDNFKQVLAAPLWCSHSHGPGDTVITPWLI